MEIDITDFVVAATPRDYSESIAEIGQHAAEITWQAAKTAGKQHPMLDTKEKLRAMRNWLKNAGWGLDEKKPPTRPELNALFVQLISGDLREAGIDENGLGVEELRSALEAVEHDIQEGLIACRVFVGSNGRVYYDLG